MERDEKERWVAVGERIRSIRKKQGMTQVDLANAVEGKMGPATVSLIENAKRKPRLSTLKRIARTLHVDVEEIDAGASPEKAPAGESNIDDIRDILRRYPPIGESDLIVDRLVEQVQLWAEFRGKKGSAN